MSRIGFQHSPLSRWIDGKSFQVKTPEGTPEEEYSRGYTPIRPTLPVVRPTNGTTNGSASSSTLDPSKYVACGGPSGGIQVSAGGLILLKEIRSPIEITQILLVGGSAKCDRCGQLSNVFTDASFETAPYSVVFCKHCISESVSNCDRISVSRVLADAWRN